MTAYYNEINPYAAQWLRNLIAAGHIAAGDVDERSITDVRPDDLRPYTQCHFFAGIGVWSHALRLAGWPDNKPVWTGSCPCQPFSAAGQGKGTSDERHLWPVWYELIRECSPSTVFGEQVEAAIRHGWLDLVQDDMESSGYAFGAICLPAACTGAPHIRQRLWFVADSTSPECKGRMERALQNRGSGFTNNSKLGNANSERFNQQSVQHQRQPANIEVAGSGHVDTLAHMQYPRLQGRVSGRQDAERETFDGYPRCNSAAHFWSDADWIYCRDEKYRPVESGTFPLAHGITNRVGRLCAYGNAIVPQVATEIIKAHMGWEL